MDPPAGEVAVMRHCPHYFECRSLRLLAVRAASKALALLSNRLRRRGLLTEAEHEDLWDARDALVPVFHECRGPLVLGRFAADSPLRSLPR